jgi:hypothetical protein
LIGARQVGESGCGAGLMLLRAPERVIGFE